MALSEQQLSVLRSKFSEEEVQAYAATKSSVPQAQSAPRQDSYTIDEEGIEPTVIEVSKPINPQPIPETAAMPASPEINPVKKDPVSKLKAAGYSDEEINAYLETKNAKPSKDITKDKSVYIEPQKVMQIANKLSVDPKTPAGINAVHDHYKRDTESVTDIVANLQELTTIENPWLWIKSNYDGQAEQQYERIKQDNVRSIQKLAAKKDIELEYVEGEFFARDAQGEMQRVQPGFFKQLEKSKFESIGGIAGGFAGAAAGLNAAAAITPPVTPVTLGAKVGLAALGFTAGAIGAGLGAVAGSVAGDQLDYLESSMMVQEEWDSKVAVEKAIGTAELSAFGNLAGGSLSTMAKAMPVKMVYSKLKSIIQSAKVGEVGKAFDEAKKAFNISDDEALREQIEKFQTLTGTTLPGDTIQEQTLAMLPRTAPGGQDLIKMAKKENPNTGTLLAREIDERAKSVMSIANSITDNNSGRVFLSELDQYRTSVKTFYRETAAEGQELIGTKYGKPVASIPVVGQIVNDINRSVGKMPGAESLINQFSDVINRTEGKELSFSGLLELRRVVRELKDNKQAKTFLDKETMQNALKVVDKEVEEASKLIGDNGEWFNKWKKSNSDYTNYVKTTKNALYKSVKDKKGFDKAGIDEDQIAEALVKFSDSIDTVQESALDLAGKKTDQTFNTYTQIMSKLGPKAAASVEGKLVQKLVEKNSINYADEGLSAVNFVELNKALSSRELITVEAQTVKEVVKGFSEVFLNDPANFMAAKGLQATADGSIAVTVVGKAQAELGRRAFEKLQRLIPINKKSDILALQNQVALAINRPLDKKASEGSKEAFKRLGLPPELLTQLQAEAAKTAARQGTDNTYNSNYISLYKNDKGQVFSTPATDRRLVQDELFAAHRVLTEKEALTMINKEKLTRETLDNMTKLKLINEGYLAIQTDDGQILKLK